MHVDSHFTKRINAAYKTVTHPNERIDPEFETFFEFIDSVGRVFFTQNRPAFTLKIQEILVDTVGLGHKFGYVFAGNGTPVFIHKKKRGTAWYYLVVTIQSNNGMQRAGKRINAINGVNEHNFNLEE